MHEVTIPWISVVIPTYGAKGVELTRRCLESLKATHGLITPQLIVCDDGSDDKDFEELQQVCAPYSPITITHNKVNLGFAKTCNAGIRQADGINVILLNNDVYFDGCPALQIVADTLDVTRAGVVGTRLLYPDNTVQHGGVIFVPVEGQPIPGYWDHFGRGGPAWHPDAVTMRPSLVTGALFGMSQNAIRAVGLLDERFGMAAEDIDFQMDCLTAGMQCFYQGYSWAYHEEGRTRGNTLEEKLALNPNAWEEEQQGLVKFFDKWQSTNWTAFTPMTGG